MKITIPVKELKWTPVETAEKKRDHKFHLEFETTQGDLIKNLLDKIQEYSDKKFRHILSQYLRSNLEKIGILFETDIEFLNFLNSKLEAARFENGDVKFYIRDTATNEGTYIGSYNDTVEYNWENGNKITATYGTDLKKH